MKRFVMLLCLATASGLVCVYEEVEAVKIGYRIRIQEEQKAEAIDRGRALKYNIARLASPKALEERLRLEKIELGPPKAWQTLVIRERVSSQVVSRMPRAGSSRPSLLGKFFLGTAQAEAKESNRSS